MEQRLIGQFCKASVTNKEPSVQMRDGGEMNGMKAALDGAEQGWGGQWAAHVTAGLGGSPGHTNGLWRFALEMAAGISTSCLGNA